MFFIHADRIRYGARINQINDGVVLVIDKYPMNLDKAYAIVMETMKQQERVRLRQSGSSTSTNTDHGQSNYQNDRTITEESIVMGTDRRVMCSSHL